MPFPDDQRTECAAGVEWLSNATHGPGRAALMAAENAEEDGPDD